jgi:RNA polymerase sigma-70 factor (TIGR02943 family)
MPEFTAPSNWVKTYADALFGFALVRTGDREIAKDLVQETLLSALESRHLFRGESSEKTWLTSILKNKIIDYYRRKASDKTIPASFVDGSKGDDPFFDENGHWREAQLPVDWGGAPDEARSREFLETLRKCLSKLTAQCRGVFTLKYIEEMESDEVCKELTISPSNYWVIIHRAKLQLRHCLEKNWLEV